MLGGVVGDWVAMVRFPVDVESIFVFLHLASFTGARIPGLLSRNETNEYSTGVLKI